MKSILTFCSRYSVEIILIAIILYLCISRGMAFNVDIYEPAVG